MNFDVDSFLEKYLAPNEPIILACSTGPDSMFLLYCLLQSKYRDNVVACYFNHKTRPETDEEEAFLVDLGNKENFKVEVAQCDFEKIQKLYPSKSFEELAREKRYQFFEAVAQIHKAQYIMTAHHLDDRIETFFFNLVRGTKLTGLINMTESTTSPSPGGEGARGRSISILRPLLHLEKSEILTYLGDNKLKYFTDSTNADTDITRNKLRLDILPLFSEVNKNYKGNLSNIFSYFEEVKHHLDSKVKDFLYATSLSSGTNVKDPVDTLDSSAKASEGQEGKENSFNIADFQSLSPLLQKEVIRYIYYISNNKSTIGLSEGNIDEVIRFIGGKNNKTVKEIHGLKMKKDNKKICYFI